MKTTYKRKSPSYSSKHLLASLSNLLFESLVQSAHDVCVHTKITKNFPPTYSCDSMYTGTTFNLTVG